MSAAPSRLKQARTPLGGSEGHEVPSVGAAVSAASDMAAQRKGSVFQTIKAVAWAFLGIRGNSAYQSDLKQLNPLHIIAVALVAVALFVAGLIGLVQWVVS